MILKRLTQTTDGNVESVFLLTTDQYYMLIQHAINDLMMKGIVSVMELSEEEAKKIYDEHLEETKRVFLENVDADTLPRA